MRRTHSVVPASLIHVGDPAKPQVQVLLSSPVLRAPAAGERVNGQVHVPQPASAGTSGSASVFTESGLAQALPAVVTPPVVAPDDMQTVSHHLHQLQQGGHGQLLVSGVHQPLGTADPGILGLATGFAGMTVQGSPDVGSGLTPYLVQVGPAGVPTADPPSPEMYQFAGGPTAGDISSIVPAPPGFALGSAVGAAGAVSSTPSHALLQAQPPQQYHVVLPSNMYLVSS